MTAAEMHIAFKLGLDKVSSLQAPNFLPEEISFLLNQAQDRFMKTRYQGNNVYRTGFEESQKRIDDLRTLIKDDTAAPTLVTGRTDVWKYSLPADYRFAIMLQCYTTTTSCGNDWRPVRLVQHDDLSYLLYDPFNKPHHDYPMVAFQGTYIYIYSDGTFTPTNFRLKYLKVPAQITTSPTPPATGACELPEHTHQEIVDYAVSLAIEEIESRRYQTFKNDLTTQE